MTVTSPTDNTRIEALASEVQKLDAAPSQDVEQTPFFIRVVAWFQHRRNKPKRPSRFASIPRLDILRASESLARGETILYLAYGSNLCAATFQGQRAIRPKSALSVSVPDLELLFDLPGMLYAEPRFANTKHRSRPQLADNEHVNEKSHLLHQESLVPDEQSSAISLGWNQGLIGVVYEITQEEWKHVMRTEGGGSTYADVEIPCYPLEQGASTVPKHPTVPSLTAHTLLATNAGSRYSNGRGFGQPSKRYLDLIRSGAKEHDLPREYQEWLANLKPYMITSTRQKIGRLLLYLIWVPLIMPVFLLGGMVPDKRSRIGVTLTWLVDHLFICMWASYDYGFKWAFGDGEKTERASLLQVTAADTRS